MSSLPADLHRRVAEAIEHRARLHHVLRMDTDTPIKSGPCPKVEQFSTFARATQRGLLAFVCEGRQATMDNITALDNETRSRTSVRAVFDAMTATYRPHDLAPEEYLKQLHASGDPAVAEQEARAVAAVHFRRSTWPVAPTDVDIFDDHAEAVFVSFVDAIVSQREARSSRDVVLAPVGLDSAWREKANEQNNSVRVVEAVTDTTLTDWLADVDGPVGVYVPLVNPFTGQILTRHRATAIARAVLRHNYEHPDAPVFVFADDSGLDGFITEVFETYAQPLGAITGDELGEPEWGQMSDWTVSIITANKVFALTDSSIVFAVTHNQWLRSALQDAAVNAPSTAEALVAAAAFCLTSEEWLYEVNDHIAANLRTLRQTLLSINDGLGFDALKVSDQTAGGTHTALLLHPQLFATPATDSVQAFTALLNTPREPRESAIAVAPGELFSWSYQPQDPDPRLAVRINLAVTKTDMAEFGDRLDMITTALWDKAYRVLDGSAACA